MHLIKLASRDVISLAVDSNADDNLIPVASKNLRAFDLVDNKSNNSGTHPYIGI